MLVMNKVIILRTKLIKSAVCVPASDPNCTINVLVNWANMIMPMGTWCGLREHRGLRSSSMILITNDIWQSKEYTPRLPFRRSTCSKENRVRSCCNGSILFGTSSRKSSVKLFPNHRHHLPGAFSSDWEAASMNPWRMNSILQERHTCLRSQVCTSVLSLDFLSPSVAVYSVEKDTCMSGLHFWVSGFTQSWAVLIHR